MGIKNKVLPAYSGDTLPQRAVYLEPRRFDILVSKHGVRVNVFKSFPCPNVKRIDDTASHDIKCQLCRGSLWLDRDPVEARAVIQTQGLNKIFSKEGSFDDQTVTATFNIGVELQYMAKIELPDFTTIFYEFIQRSEGNIDRLRYPAFKVNYLIDKTGKNYIFEQDFTVDINGDIKWISTNRPSDADIYSVHYDYTIIFRALRALHINRFAQVSSPVVTGNQNVEFMQQWACKRDYLIDKEDEQANPLAANIIRL